MFLFLVIFFVFVFHLGSPLQFFSLFFLLFSSIFTVHFLLIFSFLHIFFYPYLLIFNLIVVLEMSLNSYIYFSPYYFISRSTISSIITFYFS
jgi:hypothetical protein